MYDRPLPGCIPARGQCKMDQQRVSDDTDQDEEVVKMNEWMNEWSDSDSDVHF